MCYLGLCKNSLPEQGKVQSWGLKDEWLSQRSLKMLQRTHEPKGSSALCWVMLTVDPASPQISTQLRNLMIQEWTIRWFNNRREGISGDGGSVTILRKAAAADKTHIRCGCYKKYEQKGQVSAELKEGQVWASLLRFPYLICCFTLLWFTLAAAIHPIFQDTRHLSRI